MAQRKFDAAMADLTSAIALNPTLSELRRDRGALCYLRQDFGQTLEDLQADVGNHPGNVRCNCDIAWFLATCPDKKWRDGAKALTYALKARDAAGRPTAGILEALAAAYAETGDFERAVATQEEILNNPLLIMPGHD